MEQNKELLARRDRAVAHGVARLNDLTVARASGAELTDHEGNRILDFAGGIGTVNSGHCPPEVVAAIREQAGKLVHTCFHVATYEPYVAVCEELVRLFPHHLADGKGKGETRAMLVNSGAEAVENAIKIARIATGRPAVICFTEAFHGRTLLGLSLTSKVGYKKGAGPFAPEVYRLPFPNEYRYGDGLPHGRFVHRELERLEDAFVNTVPAERVGSIIVEVVQGEGGFVPIPAEYLRGLRRICDENGIVLILDEVQSGFCRTGRWAAYEHYDVKPDLSTWAKSIASGMPLAAVVGKAELMDAPAPGLLGGTYGGNPVSCAAALATIRLMRDKDLCTRAKAIGERIFARFRAIQSRCSLVGDVRGLGAMCAMEFVHDANPHHPATAVAKAVIQGAGKRGLLLISAGAYSNIIRVLAPLVISDAELERGLGILEEEVLRATTAATPSNV
jgi:4-aminobutyrate aminotransferase/(S)-3-amino-2-methylpropionate transaminase